MKRLARRIADAALQLTLPLFESEQKPAITRAGARVIRLRDQFVEYELRRSRRRTIGFSIDERGLAVTAPRWVAQADIESALEQRGDWVLRKLVEWRDYATRRARLDVRWEHGAALPFLGETLTIVLDPAHRGAVARDGGRLRVALPPGAGPEQIRDSVQGWMQKQARQLFEARIVHFAGQIGVRPTRWGLSSARTRWGSCGADGSIRLNWRLLHFPPDIVDYVVCHELAHLKELNHGPQFWTTVGELFPEYQRAREWLRNYPDDVRID